METPFILHAFRLESFSVEKGPGVPASRLNGRRFMLSATLSSLMNYFSATFSVCKHRGKAYQERFLIFLKIFK